MVLVELTLFCNFAFEMKNVYILLITLLMPFYSSAQWTTSRTGEKVYHCAGCVGIADLKFTTAAVSMDGAAMADVTLCDSLGRTLAQWHKMPFGEATDSAAVLHRFVSHRQGYVELLIYRPTEWDPRQMETFTYIIPTIKTEK